MQEVHVFLIDNLKLDLYLNVGLYLMRGGGRGDRGEGGETGGGGERVHTLPLTRC